MIQVVALVGSIIPAPGACQLCNILALMSLSVATGAEEM